MTRTSWAPLVRAGALVLIAACHGSAATDSGSAADTGSASEDAPNGARDAEPPLDLGPGETPDAATPDTAPAPDAADAGLPTTLTATITNTRFYVRDHMRASIEMQISGEPFAQLLGYNLTGFVRVAITPDQYYDPANHNIGRTDPLAYGLAVENYEYSKQPMNNLSFESGAGLSLMFGPLLNPHSSTGAQAYQLLANRFQEFAIESHSGTRGSQPMINVPPPSNNPLNWYGWPGLRPVFAEFASFDPAIRPSIGLVGGCFLGGAFTYSPARFNRYVANYECDYNTLGLVDRDTQATKALDLGALGYVVWKQGLWSINYWGTLHDVQGNGITVVTSTAIALVGQPDNNVVGQFPDPADPTGTRLLTGVPGTYLGDIPIEGWQGLLMMDEIDNKSALLLGSLVSSDGATLIGAPSIRAAIDYSYDSPLLYFPALVSVTETRTATSPELETKYFSMPTALAIADGTSRLSTLSGLIGGYGEAFAFTDHNNMAVGGSVPFLATFDGDPFPPDDGMPDGESTLHDRALGILKIALVDLDRLHFDPTAKVLVDTATVTPQGVVRGRKVTTVELSLAIVALRNAFRSLNGSLQLYSNDTPDTLGAPAALDAALLTGASFTGTLQAHITAIIRAEADFLDAKLIDSNGAVSNGWDLDANAPDGSPAVLEAETGAIRALLDAYLATSDQRYRTRAIAVYADLTRRFWMDDVRAYRTIAGEARRLAYTPIRYGMLQGALRQYYKLVASSPDRQGEAMDLLARIKRSIKLVLNGWDDRDQDDHIQYPDECVGTGLEMAERALTAELGRPGDMGDREHDCIREISYVHLPAALAAELQLTR